MTSLKRLPSPFPYGSTEWMLDVTRSLQRDMEAISGIPEKLNQPRTSTTRAEIEAQQQAHYHMLRRFWDVI